MSTSAPAGSRRLAITRSIRGASCPASKANGIRYDRTCRVAPRVTPGRENGLARCHADQPSFPPCSDSGRRRDGGLLIGGLLTEVVRGAKPPFRLVDALGLVEGGPARRLVRAIAVERVARAHGIPLDATSQLVHHAHLHAEVCVETHMELLGAAWRDQQRRLGAERRPHTGDSRTREWRDERARADE